MKIHRRRSKEQSHRILILLAILLAVIAVSIIILLLEPKQELGKLVPPRQLAMVKSDPSTRTEAEWRAMLTPEQYHILREAGTEEPFTGSLEKEKRKGTYYSYGCDKPLFRSEQKYDSGTGWPSFWAPVKPGAVIIVQSENPTDDRVEIQDPCGSHLGHIFDDGPKPTGQRYCMNSDAMYFVPDKVQ